MTNPAIAPAITTSTATPAPASLPLPRPIAAAIKYATRVTAYEAIESKRKLSLPMRPVNIAFTPGES